MAARRRHHGRRRRENREHIFFGLFDSGDVHKPGHAVYESSRPEAVCQVHVIRSGRAGSRFIDAETTNIETARRLDTVATGWPGRPKNLHRGFSFDLSFDNRGLGKSPLSSNLLSQTCLIPDMARRALAAWVPDQATWRATGGRVPDRATWQPTGGRVPDQATWRAPAEWLSPLSMSLLLR
jgi:hypothetical protein